MTQNAQIIEYLRLRGGATVRDMVIDLNINSPTKRISELVKTGAPIEKEWGHRINKFGENKRFMIYRWKERKNESV